MPHLTLQLHSGQVEVSAEEAQEAITMDPNADNVYKWVFCAMMLCGIQGDKALHRTTKRTLTRGLPGVLDCRL